MAEWIFNPNDYQEQTFVVVPSGDHRVRIEDVAEKTFNSGNCGFELTLSVNGYNSKIWYYLVLDHNDPKKTNQRLGDFFNSFGIVDYDMSHYRGWIGKAGAVRVKHEAYNGNTSAKVAYVINRKKQEGLTPWKDMGGVAAPTAPVAPAAELPELPF